jgi:4-carboxymuconolactone decarboxylase
MTSSDAYYDDGLRVRREVLGREYVDPQIKRAETDPITAMIQKLVTEFCWGAVWTRSDLDRKSRSLINIAMLCALNRPHELKIHVRGALNNGVTKEQIREVLLQVAVYCGFPASNEGFRVAKEAFKEMEGAK